MIPIHKGTRVTVVGLGVHGGGLGTVLWLLGQGAQVLITDPKSKQELSSSITLVMREYGRLKAKGISVFPPEWCLGVAHKRSDIRGAQLLVVNPDVPRSSPVFAWARANAIPIRIGDTSLFLERFLGPVIGITGTRGKTTTTTLLGDMVRRQTPGAIVAGNLRVSPLQFLKDQSTRRGITPAVLELSSWQVEGLRDIKRSPHIAVVTNIFPDHLNRYRSIAHYARSKALLLKYQTRDDHAVLLYDQTIVRKMANRSPAHLWWVSARRLPAQRDGAYHDRGVLWVRCGGHATAIMRSNALSVAGEHMLLNILFAIAAASAAGVKPNTIKKSILVFRGVWGRNQLVRTIRGVQYVNDTTATIPEATLAAIQSLPNNQHIILLAGGADKNLNYKKFVSEVIPSVKALVLFNGSASDRMLEAIEQRKIRTHQFPVVTAHVRSMRSAVKIAHRLAKRGDVVLLSPAAASFGVFKHAYDRGEQFDRWVKKLCPVQSRATAPRWRRAKHSQK